jgi:hypothetical protein
VYECGMKYIVEELPKSYVWMARACGERLGGLLVVGRRVRNVMIWWRVDRRTGGG